MSLIIYGHPRSRTNLLCSHLEGFPNETFDLSKVNKNLELDWEQSFDFRENIYDGTAARYLEKIKLNTPKFFKIFGFHLNNWPESFAFIKTLNYPVLRIYRDNKFDAIISTLIAENRGWTSQTQVEIAPFDVTLRQFVRIFNSVVVHDLFWEKQFQYDYTLEYNDVPIAIKDGLLEKYGVKKTQLYKIENQESLKDAKILINNFKELIQWNELLLKERL